MAKQVMDIQNSHGISQGESNENQRKWSEKQWQNRSMMTGRNYDYTRRHLNFEIADGKVQKIDTSKSIDQKMREMVAARGMHWPNDPNPRRKPGQDDSKVKERNVAACFIFEGSRERMHEIAFGGYGVVNLNRGADNSHVQRKPEIEQWALDTYNWVGKKFGYENIASFYVHLDETNPHIHCDVLPVAMVKDKERVSYQKVFGGESKEEKRRKWRAFHDSYYAEVGSKWGLDRGDDIEVTGAKHKTFEEYKYELLLNIKRAETRVKGLTSMVGNLETRKLTLNNEVSELEQGLKAGHGEVAALETKKRELKEVEIKLQDKQSKLTQAIQDLEDLRQTIDGKQKELDSLNLRIHELEAQIETKKQQLFRLSAQKDVSEAERESILTEIATLRQELHKLEGKKISLSSGMSSAIGAKLQSWGDSITRKVQGRDEEVREKTMKETRSQIMREMVGVSGPWKDSHIPSPKEYAEQYRFYKQAAEENSNDAFFMKKHNQELEKEVRELRDENRKARGERWLLSELLQCPDRQLWNNLRVYLSGSVWRCEGTYAGMHFSEPLTGNLESNSLADILSAFDFQADDANDWKMRSIIAEMFIAVLNTNDLPYVGGGGGDTGGWGREKDEDWFRESFRQIFHAAKSKLKRPSGRGLKR